MNTQISQGKPGNGIIILNSSVLFYAIIFTSFLMAASLFLAAGAQNASAADNAVDQACVKCHMDMVQENMSKAYVHAPFMQHQCSVCHVNDGITVEENKKDAPAENKKVPAKNIRWIDYNVSPAVESWFFIPAEKVSHADLVVSAFSDSQQNFQKIF